MRWDCPALRPPPALPCPDRNAGAVGTQTPAAELVLCGREGARRRSAGGVLASPMFGTRQLGVPGRRALLRDFVGNLPPQRLLKQKLQSLTDIVNSKVFQSYGG